MLEARYWVRPSLHLEVTRGCRGERGLEIMSRYCGNNKEDSQHDDQGAVLGPVVARGQGDLDQGAGQPAGGRNIAGEIIITTQLGVTL